VDRKAVRAHLIDPLFDQLAQEVDKAKQIAEIRAQAWDRRLIVAADADTPYLTLVEVMYTAGRAEFSNYAIVVEDPMGFDLGQIVVRPFGEADDPPDGSPRMTLELSPGRFTISHGPDHDEAPVAGTNGDYAKLSGYARALKREHADAHRVVLSA